MVDLLFAGAIGSQVRSLSWGLGMLFVSTSCAACTDPKPLVQPDHDSVVDLQSKKRVTVSLGSGYVGSRLEHKVLVRNESRRVCRLTRIKASCNCQDVHVLQADGAVVRFSEARPVVLGPFSSVCLALGVSVPRPGKSTSRLAVVCEQGSRSFSARFDLKVIGKRRFKHTENLVFGDHGPAATASSNLWVAPTEVDDSVRVRAAEIYGASGVRVVKWHVQPLPSGRGVNIPIMIQMPKRSGAIGGLALVRLDDSRSGCHVIEVPWSGRVVTPVTMKPERVLCLGRFRRGDSAKAAIEAIRSTGGDLVYEGHESTVNGKRGVVELADIKSSGPECSMVVHLKGVLAPGLVRGALKVKWRGESEISELSILGVCYE